MQCPECGAEIKDGDKFCPSCGTHITYTEKVAEAGKRFCPNCGAELNRDDIFCGYCGTKMGEFGTERSRMPKGTKRRPIGVTIIAILYVFGGIIGFIGGFSMMALSGNPQWYQYYIEVSALFGIYISEEEAALLGMLGMVSIIVGFAYIIIGYGIWTLKRWARMAAIIMVIIEILRTMGQPLWMPTGMGDYIGSVILTIIIGGIIIWYLSKPEVKEVFEGRGIET